MPRPARDRRNLRKHWRIRNSKPREKYDNIHLDTKSSVINSSTGIFYFSLNIWRLLKWMFAFILGWVPTIRCFLSKISLSLRDDMNYKREKNDSVFEHVILESRLLALETNFKECLNKLKSLESIIDNLAERTPPDRNESNLPCVLAIDPLKSMENRFLSSTTTAMEVCQPLLPSSLALPPPPPPPLPPLPPPLPLASLSPASLKLTAKPIKIIVTQKLDSKLDEKKTFMKGGTQPRPLISLEDITNVKLKKTPCIPKKDNSSAIARISIEAIRSVKLRKTFEHSRRSPQKIKSPSRKTSTGTVHHRFLTNPSLLNTPKRSCHPYLSGDDLTPVITSALKKRFDALNYSFEDENKENDEPF